MRASLDNCKVVILMTGTPTLNTRDALDETYVYPLGDGIRAGYICDYKILLPDVTSSDTGLPMELAEAKKGAHSPHLVQALFLVNGMLARGARRCIAYLSTIEECDVFAKALKLVCERYHYCDVWAESYTAETNRATRDQLRLDFEAYDKEKEVDLRFLCSVHVLDEGVNVVECDSIFMPSAPKSGVTFVQRLCRANRLTDSNPSKVVCVFLWVEDHEDTMRTFRYLVKCDSACMQKCRILGRDYGRGGEEATRRRLESERVDFVRTLGLCGRSAREDRNER